MVLPTSEKLTPYDHHFIIILPNINYTSHPNLGSYLFLKNILLNCISFFLLCWFIEIENYGSGNSQLPLEDSGWKKYIYIFVTFVSLKNPREPGNDLRIGKELMWFPTFKQGKKADQGNDRPISLTLIKNRFLNN